MVGQPDRGSTGRQLSVWLPNYLVEKLERIAQDRGVKRNRALTQVVAEAEDPE